MPNWERGLNQVVNAIPMPDWIVPSKPEIRNQELVAAADMA